MKRIPIFLLILSIIFVSVNFFQSCIEEDPLSVKGNIEGTILDQETNQPVNGANITITANSNTTFVEQSKSTGSDGKFSFKDIEAGSFKLSFNKNGYETNSKNVNITAGQTSSGDISLKPIKSELKTSLTQLDFGTNTNSLPVEVTNSGKGTLDWSIVEDLTWLTVSPLSGKTTTDKTIITVTVDRTGMASGSKTGSFIIKSNGGSVTINITLSVAGPVLGVDPANLNFGDTEIEKSINISNKGVGALTFNATTAQSWITITGATGSVSTDIKSLKVTVNRAGLSPGDYTGSIVVNSNSNSIQVPVSMKVSQPTIPDVLNGISSGITYNSAQVSGNLISLGSSAVTQRGHCWSTTPNPTTANNKTQLGGTNVTGVFTSTITGLTPNTTYYVKAYATNSVGTKYSDEITFKTLAPPTLATVRTLKVENIKHNQADLTGDITELGDGLITDHGFCYSSSNASPSINDPKSSLGSTTKLGNFAGTVTGLSQLTKYYIRAYAVNSLGTAYGSVMELTTATAPPVVTNGLVAYYNFDNDNCAEAQGKTEYNGVKQGTGTPVYTTDMPGPKGKAIQMDDKSYYQVATSPFIGNQAEYSISVWVKTTTSSNLIISHNTSSVNPGLGFLSNYVYACIDGWYNSGWSLYGKFDINVSDLLTNGTWHMLTVTRKSGVFRMYIDGVYYSNYSLSSTLNTNSLFYILRGYTGKTDNIRIYNREITINEIKEIYNAKQ